MAASKVNVKFVVVLGAVLLMVFGGVAGAFVFIKLKSGDRYARLGDAAAAKGDIDAADRWYARAVGKDQSRVDWLVKWRDVRRKKVPTTQSAYQDDYMMYVSLLRTLAAAKRTDVAAHRDYLEELYQQGASAANIEGQWKGLISETESAMRYFEPEKPPALRRYRGVATMALLALPLPSPLTQEQIDRSREDLEAALKADPKDATVAIGLCNLHRVAAKEAEKLGKTEDAAAERAAGVKVIDDLLVADPASALGKVQRLLLDAVQIEESEDSRKSPQEIARARAAAVEALRPRLSALADELKAMDPKALTLEVVGRFTQLALPIDPKGGPALAVAVADRALSGDKDNADIMWVRTHAMLAMAEPQKAIEQYQAIIDLPNKPVSLAGMRLLELRTRAMFLQTSTSLSQALTQTTPEARAAAVEASKKFREQLARNVPEHSPEMLLVDGKTRFITGDFRGAQQALSEFVRAPGSAADLTFDAYLYLADIAQRNNELGLAEDCLEKLVAMRPNSVEPMMMLATLYTQLQRPAEALRIYERVLDLDPDNDKARQNVGVLRALVNSEKLSDPVMQALVDAQRVILGTRDTLGDDKKGIEKLEEAVQKLGPEPRLIIALARLHGTRGETEAASKALEQGLAAHPDDASLKAFLAQVKASSTLPGMLELIEQSQAGAADKAWMRYRAYTSYEKTAEADTALDELTRLAPQDVRVLEARFTRALTKRDFTTAQTLTEQAVKTNADSSEGNTYRARLMLAQGDLKGAVAVLQRSADLGNANQGLLRTLGVALLQLGRQEDGISMLRRALALNPGDLTTIKMVIRALDQTDHAADALAVARESQLAAQQDAEFLNDWLALEAAAGNRDFATKRREQLYERNKGNIANGAALADLYMDVRDWDKARALIDGLRQGNETDIRLASIAARWHADRGDVTTARKVFVDLIGAIQDKQQGQMSPDAYMAFGQFMLRYNESNIGLAALKQAEQRQDTKTMAVSIAVGETLLSLARWAEAEQTFRKVVEANIPDPQHRIRKRLIETLVQQRKLDEAEKEFVALGSAADEDVEMLAQRSYAARLRGDTRRAREILDQAIAKFPNEPLPYLRRARILMLEPATIKDALADLDTAIKLRPGMWQAHRTRGQLLLDSGQVEAGLKDLQIAAENNPNLDGLRLEQIDELLRRGRESDAVTAAEAALKPRPNDTRLMTGIGERFGQAGRWSRAQRYYKMVWEQLGDEASAYAYIESLLNSTPPGFAEAGAVLASPKLNVERSVGLLMARARVARRQGKEEPARADVLAAFSLAAAEPANLGLWFSRLRQVFDAPATQLTALKAVKAPPSLADWVSMHQAMVMLDDQGTRAEAVKTLRAIVEGKGDRLLRLDAARALSMAYAKDSNWTEALAVTKVGLDLAPDDMMLNNNAASFLSENMGKAAEALPYAEKAAKLAPGSEHVRETLADVQWNLGNRGEAIRIEGEALRMAQQETDKAKWGLKLARWKLEAGDKDGARGQLNAVRELLTDAPRLVEEYKPKVDELEKEIQAAK